MADMTRTLYGGNYKYSFTESNHRHRIDGQSKKGVTSILAAVLAKPALMLWPLDTAIKYLKETLDPYTFDSLEYDEFLIHLDRAQSAHKVKADFGSDTGKQVHALVEQFLKTGELDLAAIPNAEVGLALNAFVEWYNSHDIEVIEVERPVYSQTQDYCGILDSILKIDGVTYLCDLKTSNASRVAPHGVYADHFIQLGGYYRAYAEEGDYELMMFNETDKPAIDDLMVISCRKDGKTDTVAASYLGYKPEDCRAAWDGVYRTFKDLDKLNAGLARR